MQYYITEEYEGQTVITESTAVVSADGTTHDGKNHYDVLNLILAAHVFLDTRKFVFQKILLPLRKPLLLSVAL